MSLDKLITPLALPCGVELPNRVVMAPMIVEGADPATGHVTDEDLAYFARRTRVAGAVVTQAMNVTRGGKGFSRQISIADDSDVEGLARLAATIKQDGARAIAQLYHGGRESKGAVEQGLPALAPSAMELGWLPYGVQGMTATQVEETVAAFGAATRRAVLAGFDGVEIHGANHYLIQQFFSAFSNHRTDRWGGDLEGRMAFPLAVVDEVLSVAREAGRPFVVGYRYSPEEVHGENVGYTAAESTVLVDRVAARGVDYVHVSLFTGYATVPTGQTVSAGRLARQAVAGRCPVVVVSDVATQHDAVEALAHGDLVAIGRAALVEPEFAAKIAEDRADEVHTSVKGRMDDLAWPSGLIGFLASSGIATMLPIDGLDEYLP